MGKCVVTRKLFPDSFGRIALSLRYCLRSVACAKTNQHEQPCRWPNGKRKSCEFGWQCRSGGGQSSSFVVAYHHCPVLGRPTTKLYRTDPHVRCRPSIDRAQSEHVEDR